VLPYVSLLKSLEGLAPREESRSKGVVERRQGGKVSPNATIFLTPIHTLFTKMLVKIFHMSLKYIYYMFQPHWVIFR
jgi:hypothetical protein